MNFGNCTGTIQNLLSVCIFIVFGVLLLVCLFVCLFLFIIFFIFRGRTWGGGELLSLKHELGKFGTFLFVFFCFCFFTSMSPAYYSVCFLHLFVQVCSNCSREICFEFLLSVGVSE